MAILVNTNLLQKWYNRSGLFSASHREWTSSHQKCPSISSTFPVRTCTSWTGIRVWNLSAVSYMSLVNRPLGVVPIWRKRKSCHLQFHSVIHILQRYTHYTAFYTFYSIIHILQSYTHSTHYTALYTFYSVIHILQHYTHYTALYTFYSVIHILQHYTHSTALYTFYSILHILQHYTHSTAFYTFYSILHILQHSTHSTALYTHSNKDPHYYIFYYHITNLFSLWYKHYKHLYVIHTFNTCITLL